MSAERSRLEAVRRSFASHHVDAFLVTELSSLRYLTGFTGSNGLCFVTPRRALFVTDGRYRLQAPREVAAASVAIARGGLFTELLARRVVRPGVRIGIEAEQCSVASLKTLRRLFPRCRFVALPPVIARLASVKDTGELKLLRRAMEITDAVFARLLDVVKAGVRELDVAAEISYWHRKYGADSDSFEPIVASGPRGAMPHAKPSAKKLRNGEMVIIDFGCRFGGYCSDLTRTLAIGRPSAEMKTIYGVVREAQQRAIDAARAGMEARALDAVARSYIRRSGYGRRFVHSLGHGLGLYIHDPLRLSPLSREVLLSRQVVTIEPGIYLPGRGGVRIEDDILITPDGCTIMTRSPRDLLIV